MNDQRMAQVRRFDKGAGDYWETIPFMDMRKGDRFRLVESDGELADGGEEMIADSDPYLSDGVNTKCESSGKPISKNVPTIQGTVIKDCQSEEPSDTDV